MEPSLVSSTPPKTPSMPAISPLHPQSTLRLSETQTPLSSLLQGWLRVSRRKPPEDQSPPQPAPLRRKLHTLDNPGLVLAQKKHLPPKIPARDTPGKSCLSPGLTLGSWLEDRDRRVPSFSLSLVLERAVQAEDTP